MADSGNIKVVVRCRPMNSREKARGASNLIEVTGEHQLILAPPQEGDSRENTKATKKKHQPFSFDRSYDENTEQRTLFEYVGLDLLQHAFNGFNTCVFAYGQTGSGKSHSMVGYAEAKGLIPLTCSQLFDDITEKTSADHNLKISVEVSYIEIYNEKVRDLLNPKNKGNLKVREHPSLGPYVEDLSKLIVNSFAEIENLMDEGNKARTVASTQMNETSSRSHAVFTLVLTQRRHDEQTKLDAEKVSRISLVDLAGSERANSTGATGARLKEGANINRSLTTLGKVIAALATASMAAGDGKNTKKKAALENHVPYRDSVLTWLLKDSLGGNSKTAMIAAISPADYEETLSTLRYADQAKKIKNKAVVNEDPNAKLIRELKEELEMLRNRVQVGGGGEGEGTWDPTLPPEKQLVRYQTKNGEIRTVTKAELQDQLEQSEKIMSSLNESWEEKLQKTQEIQLEREKALEELGISVDKGNVGVHAPKRLPHLVNLNEDPLMSECLIYQIKEGRTMVGNLDGEKETQIRLSGTNILPEHCAFENSEGIVTVHAMPDSMTMVNGKRVTPDEPRRLRSGYRVILGDFHVFRFNHPEEVRRARDRIKSTMDGDTSRGTDSPARPESPMSADAGDVDWTYARREALMARLNGQDVNFENLNDDDLEKLHEEISRARIKKGVPGADRPESRMSFFDDGASEVGSIARPYSLSTYTDDTSVDPWAGSEPGSIRAPGTPSISTPPTAAAKEAATLKLKVKEYEERFSRMAAEEIAAKLSEKVVYTDEQKRLIYWALDRWRAETTVSMAEDVLSYAVLVKEANVLSRQLGKHATYQFTVIDDGALSNPTSTLDTTTIAGLGAGELDDVADAALIRTAKPCVAIRVIDRSRGSIHIWSLPKLEQRIQKMRNLYTFIDRPEYSRHFDWADPFYESTEIPAEGLAPFAFIGNALVPLRPLARRVSNKFEGAPIRSRYTGKIIATCNVEIKFVSLSAHAASKSKVSNGTLSNGTSGTSSPAPSQSSKQSDLSSLVIQFDDSLPIGHKLGLQLCIDNLQGLSGDDFSSVHLQVRLSSIAGPSVTSDDVWTSQPADITAGVGSKSEGKTSDAGVRLRKTLAFIITPEIASHLRDGFAHVEVYARVRQRHLDALEHFDMAREERAKGGKSAEEKEKSARLSHARSTSSMATIGPGSEPTTGRMSENEMISEERHDVLASVQLCEMDDSGMYVPVQVRAQSALDPGAFYLRQGLQRKLIIKLSHDSGKQFAWKGITKVELGKVRLLDAKGRVHVSTVGDPLQIKAPLKQQTVDFLSNGTSELNLWAWWDSSNHDSVYLNKPTTSGHRVLLRLSFYVDYERAAAPAQFDMDIAVEIHSRDSRPPGKLLNMIGSATSGSRVLSKTTALFTVRLVPPLIKRTRELWRLDTAAKYVRGEEALAGWKPRGVSLVHDHARLVKEERKRAEVDGVRALLLAKPPLALTSMARIHARQGSPEWGSGDDRDEISVLAKAVDWWTKALRDSKMTVLAEETEERKRATAAVSLEVANGSVTSTRSSSPLPSEAREPPALTAEIKLIPRSDAAARRGWLAMPAEAFSDHWVRRWFVVQRPYMHVYSDNSEGDEIMAINLAAVRVEHDVNVETMLNRQNVFCLYTASNSYFLQATAPRDMEAWMATLDGFHTARQS